jgi:hypothetical protein
VAGEAAVPEAGMVSARRRRQPCRQLDTGAAQPRRLQSPQRCRGLLQATYPRESTRTDAGYPGISPADERAGAVPRHRSRPRRQAQPRQRLGVTTARRVFVAGVVGGHPQVRGGELRASAGPPDWNGAARSARRDPHRMRNRSSPAASHFGPSLGRSRASARRHWWGGCWPPAHLPQEQAQPAVTFRQPAMPSSAKMFHVWVR